MLPKKIILLLLLCNSFDQIAAAARFKEEKIGRLSLDTCIDDCEVFNSYLIQRALASNFFVKTKNIPRSVVGEIWEYDAKGELKKGFVNNFCPMCCKYRNYGHKSIFCYVCFPVLTRK